MDDNIDFAGCMETVARALLGEPASKKGHEWRYGKNGSLSIDLKMGTWFDHEANEGGGVIALIKRQKGLEGYEALQYLCDLGCVTRPNGGPSANEIPYDAGSDPFKNATFKNTSKQFHIVKTWAYVDETGKELFEVCRLENGVIDADGKPEKEYLQRRRDPSAPDKYIDGVKGIRQVPYRLPELIQAIAEGRLILNVEGEKCVDAVIAAGGTATCNAMGALKWPDELTPFFKGADVVALPDNDEPGRKHTGLVSAKLQGTAKRVRVLELPGLPPKGDVVDWLKSGGTIEQFHALVEAHSVDIKPESPLPLFPPLPDAEPYPVDALGATLSRAARAIANKVQVPCAMSAQSVLAVASLASCVQADVMLPFGQARPLTLFFATVAASGDRKTSSNTEALWPVRKHERNLREEYDNVIEDWKMEHAAWSAQKRKIEGAKLGIKERLDAFVELGKEPDKPLAPFLIAGDPTIEGLTKNWLCAHAALGLFTAEGASFTGGHAMNEDNRLKTAAMFSELWDGQTITRIRAGDGVTILAGRRLAMHLMLQPAVSIAFLSNDELRDQGLLSRILVTWPESRIGSRPYKWMILGDDEAIKAYGARLLFILEAKPALAEGKRNELAPRALHLSNEATAAWIVFYNHIEEQLGPGKPLAPIKGFAAKAAEQAARIAGVVTVVEDLYAKEIGVTAMRGALILMDWYVNEALRIHQGGMTDPGLRRAAVLLEWLQAQPDANVAFRDIITFGPNQFRTKAAADAALAILAAHGWISDASARPRVVKVAAP